MLTGIVIPLSSPVASNFLEIFTVVFPSASTPDSNSQSLEFWGSGVGAVFPVP